MHDFINPHGSPPNRYYEDVHFFRRKQKLKQATAEGHTAYQMPEWRFKPTVGDSKAQIFNHDMHPGLS